MTPSALSLLDRSLKRPMMKPSTTSLPSFRLPNSSLFPHKSLEINLGLSTADLEG